MAVTSEDIEREKDRLPRGWGRFGKSIERVAEIAEPDESLLSTCVCVNPDFTHHYHGVRVLKDLTKETNLVLGLTDRRLILVTTGLGGGPRDEDSISLEGLEVAEREKKKFTLEWPDGRLSVEASKRMLPDFLDQLAARAA